MISARHAPGGGTRPPSGPPTWLAQPTLSFYAIACPFGGAVTAARLALDATSASIAASPPVRSSLEPPACAQLRSAVLAAEGLWRERVLADASLRGQGATFAAVVLAGGHAVVAHLGDCRVHQIRNGKVHRKTIDHVLASSTGRRVLARGIGLDSNPHVVPWDIEIDDVFLLSAGVHEVVTDNELLEVLGTSVDFAEAACRLLDLASLRAARDDLTVLIAMPAVVDAG